MTINDALDIVRELRDVPVKFFDDYDHGFEFGWDTALDHVEAAIMRQLNRE